MDTTTIGGTTATFAEGKALSHDLRASTPEQMNSLVRELERISVTAKDYVVGGPNVGVVQAGPSEVKVTIPTPGLDGPGYNARMAFDLSDVAHTQVADKMGIPLAYYRRMQAAAPGLLTTNVNHWLGQAGKNFMLRTLDGRCRAFLSDRYRVLDNYSLFFHTGDVARKMGAVIQRLDLTDERFYMRLMAPDFAAKITGRGENLKEQGRMFSSGYRTDNGTWQGPDDDDPSGDWVFPGIVVSNSEVGRGGLTVEASAYRTTCQNLIIVSQTIHKVHLGEVQNSGVRIQSDTQQAKDEALWLEVRDVVQSTFTPEIWADMVQKLNNAQAQTLAEPAEAVDAVVKNYGLPEDERQFILNELISPSRGTPTGPTVWGLLNAITVRAHDKGVDDGVTYERLAGDLLKNAGELVAVR